MTNLIEPNFIERDPDKITAEWIKLYEEKSGKTLQPAQIEQLMIDVGAYRETLLRIEIQETAKKNLLSYAPLDVLRHIGEPLGVEQLLADCAVTSIKFSIDEVLDFNLVIPKGTQIETKDGLFTFETIENVILLSGNLDVTVEAICQTAGTKANGYQIGSINNLITPLSYISNAENVTVSSGGADDEDAESLRERIRQAPEKFSNAGSKGAYRYHTFSAHQSIIDAAILSPSPGVVNIYPLTDSGNPSNEIINIVQEHLSDEKVRPLTDYVQVLPPERIDFQINAELTLFLDSDADTVLSVCNSKIEEYKKNLAEKLGKNVIRTQIIAILNSVYGVYKTDLLSPAADINIAEYQWADLTGFNITVRGYADE